MRRFDFNIFEKLDILLIATILIFTVFLFTTGVRGEQKILLVFVFYFAISLVYAIDSRFPIGAAILLLIVTVIYIPRNEEYANQLAIYAYYFLVVGIALQVIEHVRKRKEVEAQDEQSICLSENIVGKYIAIVSGKGGVGKTTIATNLAVILSRSTKCLLIDFDMTMPAIDIAMGIETNKTLKDALSDNELKPPVYSANGCDVIPASPHPTFFQDYKNVKKLKSLVETIRNKYNVVIMDFPPGSNIELLNEFGENLNLILVANPDKPSLVNLYTIKDLIQKTESKVIGLVINKAYEDIDIDNIEAILEVSVIGILPEDRRVRESFDKGTPAVLSYGDMEFSTEINDLARFLLKYLNNLA